MEPWWWRARLFLLLVSLHIDVVMLISQIQLVDVGFMSKLPVNGQGPFLPLMIPNLRMPNLLLSGTK